MELEPIAMRHDTRNISTLRWFSVFGVYIAALALFLLWAYDAGNTRGANIAFFIIYVSLACTFIPLPILWIFLWISREHNPFLVASLGAIATSIANLHDYYILNSMLRIKRLSRLKESRWYRRAASWFERYPFWTLSIANFLPLPVDVVRLLAISTGYSRIPFTGASLLGRFPRYLILATVGYELKLSNKGIVIVLCVTIVIAAVKMLSKGYSKWRESSM